MASVRGLETVRVLRCRVINQSINHELVNTNTKKQCDARGIRTPNLEVWNLTRYRCAMASCGCGDSHKARLAFSVCRGTGNNSNAKNNNGEKKKEKTKKNDTPGGTRTRNPQIRSLMRYPLRHWGTWEF